MAQLVARLHGMQKVEGSSPSSSTQFLPESEGSLLGGLVAGEGSFYTARRRPFADGTPRLRFVFAVAMASRDRPLLVRLQRFLGTGTLSELPPRHDRWLGSTELRIVSIKGHYAATMPFADKFLIAGQKRDQYLAWKDDLITYERAVASLQRKGRSTCSRDGCELPVRGRGVCRRHYYELTGY